MLLWTQKVGQKKEDPLTEAEVDEIIREWKPTPLTPPLSPSDRLDTVVIEGAAGPHVKIEGREVINFTSNDFLGLNGHKEITEKALQTIDRYGCGSCGPRGFYGTIDVHVQLEEKLAEFMGTQKCIVFAADLATISSTIPTFSKRDDIIVCDEGCGYNIQEGCRLSRSKVILFKHNDMHDLEQKLKSIVEADSQGKKRPLNRRFIIFEGLYPAYGDIAPLKQLVALKHKYKFRLILDESYSLGVLGQTGRGLTEHAGVPISDVDIICASMAHSLASMGGFCCGMSQMVDHQRLAATGYVFSASSPPYLSVAAMGSLEVMAKEKGRFTSMRERAGQLQSALRKAAEGHPFVKVLGQSESPIAVLALPNDQAESQTLARKLRSELLGMGFLVFVIQTCIAERRSVSGVRFHVTAAHTAEDVEKLAAAVSSALAKVLRK